jgi:hypothetical protein
MPAAPAPKAGRSATPAARRSRPVEGLPDDPVQAAALHDHGEEDHEDDQLADQQKPRIFATDSTWKYEHEQGAMKQNA